MVTRSNDQPFEVFFDGGCFLCRSEIQMLQKRDHGKRIRFTDFAADNFDWNSIPLSYAELMKSIHGRMPEGDFIQGADVFRELYERTGWVRTVKISRWPIIRPTLNGLYRVFAWCRLRYHRNRCDDSCTIESRTGKSQRNPAA